MLLTRMSRGPSFEDLVAVVAGALQRRVRVVHASPRLVLALARIVGIAKRDVLLTAEELAGLQASLLVSAERPRGTASFRSWVRRNGAVLGRGYVSELGRNFRPYDPA